MGTTAGTPHDPPTPIPGFRLVGEDGHAFAILGRFQRQARRAGWTSEQVAEVRTAAIAGDYNVLLATMMPYEDASYAEEEW